MSDRGDHDSGSHVRADGAVEPVSDVPGHMYESLDSEAIEELREVAHGYGVSPPLPNIPPPRNASPMPSTSTSNPPPGESEIDFDAAQRDRRPSSVAADRPSRPSSGLRHTRPTSSREDDGNGARETGMDVSRAAYLAADQLKANEDRSKDSSSISRAAPPHGFDGSTIELPMPDHQKAEIVARHLVSREERERGGSQDEDASGLQTTLSGLASDASGAGTPQDRDTNPPDRSPPSSSVDYNTESPFLPPSEPSGSNFSRTQTLQRQQSEFDPPHDMLGGDVTSGIYKWAHENRKRVRRTNSLDLPRDGPVDPDVPRAQDMRQPGGFRRNFVFQRAQEQGQERPRVLRSFIDFLTLYGHLGGEDLEEIDESELAFDEEEAAEAEAAAEAPPPGAEPTSPERGRTERTPLLQRARSRPRGKSVQRPGEASVTEAVLMLTKSFIGTGVLFLGKAFSNGGILFSTVTLVTIAALSLWSFLLLIYTRLDVPGSFGDMGGALYGPTMRKIILFQIVISQLGFVMVYMAFTAETLQAFIMAVTKCRVVVPKALLLIAQFLVFLPMSLIRKIKKLSGTALVADAFILAGIIYLFSTEISIIAKNGLGDVQLFNPNDFPLLVGTSVFAFEGISLIIPISESMKEPERFPAVLTGVMILATVIFASSGVLAYGAFGSEIQAVVITNLPPNDKFVQATQCLYSIAIMLSTPLQLFPAIRIMENGIFSLSGKFSNKVKFEKNVFRCCVVLLCAFVAWIGGADLDKFVSLIGSVACVPLGFIYPPLLHLKARATRRLTKTADVALLVFGVCCLIFTTSQTLYHMFNPASQPQEPEGSKCKPPTPR